MSEQCPTCKSYYKTFRLPMNAMRDACTDLWHYTPSQQIAMVNNYGASPPIAPMHYGVDMAQGESQYIVRPFSQAQIDSICGVPDGAVVQFTWAKSEPKHFSVQAGFGPYEPPYRVADMSEANSQCIRRWNMKMKPIAPQAKPLPPGATRHTAISARCLALDCAADFMIGMRR